MKAPLLSAPWRPSVALVLAALWLVGCAEQPTTPDDLSITAAKGGKPSGDPITVDAVDPDSAVQDTTLDVHVFGSGYDQSAAVTFERPDGGRLTTNSTSFVSPTELVANVTVAIDADTGSYDVVVQSSKGRKGIGSELFKVKVKPGVGNQIPDTVSFIFRDQEASDSVFGDGRVSGATGGTAYTSDQCGVAAVLRGGSPVLSTNSNRIRRSEATACNGKEGRIFEVHFPTSFGGAGPLDWDGQTVNAKWMELRYGLDTIPLGQTQPAKLWITFDDQGEHGGGGSGWGQACPGRLEFDNDWDGSSRVDVTRVREQPTDEYDEWKIEAGPEDVAVCLGWESGEPFVLGYYHLPFQVNLVCRGEC